MGCTQQSSGRRRGDQVTQALRTRSTGNHLWGGDNGEYRELECKGREQNKKRRAIPKIGSGKIAL